jgi:hypothetical protein
MIPLLTPKAEAQHRPMALTVTPGLRGYRLAFVGGSDFDVIGEIPNVESASLAHLAAMQAVADLNRIFNTTKGAA